MSPTPFDTVLVANRGEIAVRVIRTLRAPGHPLGRRLQRRRRRRPARRRGRRRRAHRPGAGRGRATSTSTRSSPPRARTGAQAVHPGYGFLSENAEFAAAPATTAGIVFIGPPAAAHRDDGRQDPRQGDGVARSACRWCPGIARPGLTDDDLIAGAAEVGYPRAGQAVGRRRRQGHADGRRRPASCPPRSPRARREAAAAFGDDTLFLERFVLRPAAHRGAGARRRATATSSTSASASAACSAGTRRSSRRRRRRCWTRRPAPASARPRATPRAASTTSAPARSSSSSPPTGPTSSSSWR